MRFTFMMITLIDFTQIPAKKVGVGVYALNTFKQVFRINTADRYIAVIQNDDPDFREFRACANVTVRQVSARIFRNFFFRLLIEQIYIPFLILKYRASVVHSLHYSFPLLKLGARRVITIHDLTFFIYPELHTRVKRHYFRWFTRQAAHSRNTLICVSNSTAADLKRIFPRHNAEVHVVPLAIGHGPQGDLPFEPLREKFRLHRPYILFVGTLEPRKNIVSLLEAYRHISESRDELLVIVGKKGWFYESIFTKVKELELNERVRFTGFVSEEEKFALIRHCRIFIYPSLYEGFGLPVLEALSMGIPTITSNISSMPEVAGDAALLIDPLSVNEIAGAMSLLLSDPGIQDRLKQNAWKQARLFSWERTATETVTIYKKNTDI